MGFILFVCMFLFAVAPTSIDAWGPEGHYMVCKIAERYLTTNATEAVRELLPHDAPDLASVCSWPDEVRKQYRWSSVLHFVNTPGVCNYDYSRDCHADGQEDFCVVAAIRNYTKQLETYQQSPTYNLTEALMFLAHFMGDIHQPLHCGFAADYGGNTIRVKFYDVTTNLHKLWDENMLQKKMNESFRNDLNRMAEELSMEINAQDRCKWEACGTDAFTCANKFASESIELACALAYKDVNQDCTLGDDYFNSRISTVEQRIVQAAVRLASILNNIFSIKKSSSRNISQVSENHASIY